MKRNSKLLAFAVALAMAMSMITIPVSALGTGYVAPTGVNLLPEWGYGPWNYESTSNTATAKAIYGFTGAAQNTKIAEGFDRGASVSATNSVITPGAGPDGSAASLKTIPYVNASGAAQSYDGPQLQWIPLEANAIYVISVDMKLGPATTLTNKNIRGMYITYDATKNTVKPTVATGTKINSSSVNIKNNAYTTVTGWFKTETNPSGDGSRCHTHVSVQFNDKNVKDVYVDNWSVVKVGTLDITNKVDNGDATATYTFNNTLGEITANDFVVDAIEGKNAPTLSVAKSGNTCTVTLSNYSYDTAYTLRAKPQIEDIYGQVLPSSASRAVVVTTPAAPTPALTATAVDNGDGSATFTFNNALKDVEKSNFTVYTTAEDAKLADWTVEATDDYTVVVTLTDYSYETAYTIAAKVDGGVTDEYGQNLAEVKRVTVTTPAEPIAALSATAVDNGDGSATFTFNNALVDVVKSNFTAYTSVEGAKTADWTVETTDDKTVVVTLTDYSYETAYTIAAKADGGVTDEHGQSLAEIKRIVITTPEKPSDNFVERNNYDGTFETAAKDASYGINRGGTNVTLNVRENAEVAYEGSKYLEIVKNNPTATAANSTVAFLLKNGLTAGKTYVVTYYVRTAEGNNTIKSMPSASNSSSIVPGNADGTYTAITEHWTKVTDYFTAEASTGTECTLETRIVVRNNGTVYVDNFSVYELNALDVASYFARITKAANNVEVEITNKATTAPAVYCIAAKYADDGRLADVKLGTKEGISTLTNKAATYKISGINDAYKLFIWTETLQPLTNSPLSISDL